MSAARLSPRKFSLILADAAIIYGGVILAMYLRLGLDGPPYELNERNGWLKIGLVSLVCIINLYFYDLYTTADGRPRRFDDRGAARTGSTASVADRHS